MQKLSPTSTLARPPYQRTLGAAVAQTRAWWRSMAEWTRADLQGARYSVCGALLALCAIVTLALYYHVMPAVELDPDTPAYLEDARRISAHGLLVDPARLPGYPLMIALIFALGGGAHLVALGLAQAALFVVAVVEVYAALCLALRRSWLALLIALPVAVNTQLISYVKPILSEALTLFLLTTMALMVAIFLRRPGPRRLWGVALSLLALFLTRPEWIYLPAPLLAYLLLIAGWRERARLRRLLPHALAALVALYLILGVYVLANGAQNHFYGVTYIQNINLLGKVMQYHMQDEAPAQFADVTHIIDRSMARGDLDPWHSIGPENPTLHRDYQARAAAYAIAIIRQHPLEYLGKSLALGRDSLAITTPFRPAPPTAALAPADALTNTLMSHLGVFPLLALGWLGALGWRLRRRARDATQSVPIAAVFGALALIGLYGLAITTLGGYIYYGRLHSPFVPCMIVVVWGSLILAARALIARIAARRQ